ncbi:MAG: O-antigen ligase family protein [Candidatus Omnitrophica bacterium]|nr:O-antigen ligase family protein [Candidatus Omnitrophota bacterium]
MADRNQVINRCDQIMFYALCGLAWFLPISIALVEWMFAIAFIAWITKRGVIFSSLMQAESPSAWLSRVKLFGLSFKPKQNAINLPVLVFFAVIIVSAVFGIHPLKSLSAILTKVLQWFFTAIIVVEVVTSKKRLRIMGAVLLASVVLVTLNGLFQYMTGTGLIRQRVVMDGRRVMSTFRHPNDLAGWLTIMLPLVFSFSFIQFFRMREGRDAFLEGSDDSGFFQSRLFVALSALLLALAAFNLGVTYSRGGWLACGVVLLALVIRKPKMLIPFALIGSLFLAVFVVKMIGDRETNIGGSYVNIFTNVSDRGKIWGEGWGPVRERPLLGIGVNNYVEMAEKRHFVWQQYAHNCYLQMLVETGVLGLAVFLWILVRLFREGLRQLPKVRDRFPHHFLLGLLAGQAAFLIQSFFDTNFYSTQLSSLMWLTAGLIMAIPRVELDRDGQ